MGWGLGCLKRTIGGAQRGSSRSVEEGEAQEVEGIREV